MGESKRVKGGQAGNSNAVRHGLTAGALVLPGEERRVWELLEARLREELAPVGVVEELLVHRIAACAWRLLRVQRVEGLLDGLRVSDIPGALARARAHGGEEARGWEPPDKDRHHRYDGWAKVVRYEASIERSWYRALHELEDVQRERRGREASARRKGPGFAG